MPLSKPRTTDGAAVWWQFAHDIGAQYTEGYRFPDQTDVKGFLGPWPMILDTYAVVGGYTVHRHVRMRAYYLSKEAFQFRVYHSTFFSRLGRLLGMKRVSIGVPAFDRAFTVQASDETKARRLLDDPKIRERIGDCPPIHLSAKKAFGPTHPVDVMELCVEVDRLVFDRDELRSLYELVRETLTQLFLIGCATDEQPPFEL